MPAQREFLSCKNRPLPRGFAVPPSPRTLKDPVFCKSSHLKSSFLPAMRSSPAQVSSGVRWMRPRSRRSASRTSPSPSGGGAAPCAAMCALPCAPARGRAGGLSLRGRRRRRPPPALPRWRRGWSASASRPPSCGTWWRRRPARPAAGEVRGAGGTRELLPGRPCGAQAAPHGRARPRGRPAPAVGLGAELPPRRRRHGAVRAGSAQHRPRGSCGAGGGSRSGFASGWSVPAPRGRPGRAPGTGGVRGCGGEREKV